VQVRESLLYKWHQVEAHDPGATLVFRGLRVRMGINSGILSSADCKLNRAAGRMHYTGACAGCIGMGALLDVIGCLLSKDWLAHGPGQAHPLMRCLSLQAQPHMRAQLNMQAQPQTQAQLQMHAHPHPRACAAPYACAALQAAPPEHHPPG